MEQKSIQKIVNSDDSDPIDFVNTIESKKHIILFFDDLEWAKSIEFLYIKNGLEKGEHCIYALDDDPEFIEKEMTRYGINVKKYKEQNLLHIYQNPTLHDYSNAESEGKKFWETIMSGTKPPIRVIGLLNLDFQKKEALDAILAAEKKLHSTFDNFPGSFLCPYYVQKINPKYLSEYLEQLLSHHDSAIFSPSLYRDMYFELNHSVNTSVELPSCYKCLDCNSIFPAEYEKCPKCGRSLDKKTD